MTAAADIKRFKRLKAESGERTYMKVNDCNELQDVLKVLLLNDRFCDRKYE